MKLPEPVPFMAYKGERVFTAAQMREFRNQALEEAARVCEQFTHYSGASGIICAKQIRALKEVQS